MLASSRRAALSFTGSCRAAFSAAAAAPPPFLSLDESSLALPKVLAAHPKVLTYFTASWCGPCKAIAPHFSALATAHKDITFVKIDVDDNQQAAQEVRGQRARVLSASAAFLRSATLFLSASDCLYLSPSLPSAE